VRALVEDVDPGDVRRKQVRRELEARERAVDAACERLRERRLPDSRQVLDDQMALRDQAEDGQLQRLRRRADDGSEVVHYGPDCLVRANPGRCACERVVHQASGTIFTISSTISLAIRSFGAFWIRRSPPAETSTTSFSAVSKPMSPLETS